MMEQKNLHAIEAHCTQEAPPSCRTACPFSLDVRELMLCLANGKQADGRKVMERYLPLPEVLARVCDHPCEQSCLRRELGGGLAIRELELFCVSQSKSGRSLARPPKAGAVHLVGAGFAALVVAWDLSRKGYSCTVHFEGERQSILLRDFPNLDRGVAHEACAMPGVSWESGILDWNLVEKLRKQEGKKVLFLDASAVPHMVAPREEVYGKGASLLSGHEDMCCGGWLSESPTGHKFASASRQGGEGRVAAQTLQRILDGVSLEAGREEVDKPGESRLFVDLKGVQTKERVVAQQGVFTAEEAQAEAERCLNCQCLACVRQCSYLEKHGSFPRVYARQMFNNASIVKGLHQANKLINGCALCGQCTEICPECFSMADLCLSMRQDMVNRKAMPPSAHEFALEDMENAMAQASFSVPEGGNAYALFLGCQLPASRPKQCQSLYEFMKSLWEERGGLALMQNCCGVPAHWAGQKTLFEGALAGLRQQWKALGKPQLLVACASCLKTLQEHAPEMVGRSVWEELAALPEQFWPARTEALPESFVIHDPCAARNNENWQKAVRALTKSQAVQIKEVEFTGRLTACCGYGGLAWNADGAIADGMSRHRAEELGQKDARALASCIMCRDRLGQEMECWHILDILPLTMGQKTVFTLGKGPGLSRRRANRRVFKVAFQPAGQDRLGSEDFLRISPEVLSAMERRFILREDVEVAVQGIESTGAFFIEQESGHRVGAWKPRNVTFWVRYSMEAGQRVLHSAWCHRMVVPGATQPQSLEQAMPYREGVAP